MTREERTCLRHSKKHGVTSLQVQERDCEDLPCYEDCPLMEHE